MSCNIKQYKYIPTYVKFTRLKYLFNMLYKRKKKFESKFGITLYATKTCDKFSYKTCT